MRSCPAAEKKMPHALFFSAASLAYCSNQKVIGVPVAALSGAGRPVFVFSRLVWRCSQRGQGYHQKSKTRAKLPLERSPHPLRVFDFPSSVAAGKRKDAATAEAKSKTDVASERKRG
jgi:hypothetical protein